MRKNWNAIAGVGNEQLRKNLVAATGEIAKGLALGFPQYFLNDEEESPRPVREDFINIVKEMERRDEVVQAC